MTEESRCTRKRKVANYFGIDNGEEESDDAFESLPVRRTAGSSSRKPVPKRAKSGDNKKGILVSDTK